MDPNTPVTDGRQRQRLGNLPPLRLREGAAPPPVTATPAPAAATAAPAACAPAAPAPAAPAPATTPPAPVSAAPATLTDPGRERQRLGSLPPLRTRDGAPSASAAPPPAVSPPQPAVSAPQPAAPAAPAVATTVEPGRDRQRLGSLPPLLARPGAAPTPTVDEQPVPAAQAAPPTPEVAPAPQQAPSPAPIAASTAASSAEPRRAASEPVDPEAEARSKLLRRGLLAVGGVVVLALVAVFAARWARTLPDVQAFIAAYPGAVPLPDSAPIGMPPWLGWQHFLNMFFMVMIVKTGLQVRLEKRPPGYWKPKADSFFSPKGNTPKKVSLSQWLHQSLDVFWVLNGLIFIVLLIVTGHWMRIVPTTLDVFPHMASVGLQYLSLDWPTENGWIHYNALQMLAYFVTVFIAAPLAIASGARMSTWWPQNATGLNKVFPLEAARAVHFPVMVYFILFVVAHVFLVFFTGALRNLNHMYTSRDVADAWGLVVFLVSLAVIAAGWFLLRPVFTTPLATRSGAVTKN